ncbi:hypothetical protein BKP56_06960 [Marinilactibacillus sp. 15R]|uniref:ORF6C domain-containing protein n=1 Tax=Marinilactibacillus sp. 15R TaxID=1911586 RepID=UPI00090C3EC1|nr:ORF6C domain-containing protein [Marinilactibacillus sp. 15R]API89009.1 hypothetical protein BKP56_06960 [Marinilactibacillus sp. 15R]
MNKTKLPRKNNELEALKFTLQRQDDQSKALQKVIEVISETKNEIVDIKSEIKQDVQEIRDSITVNYEEQQTIKSIIGVKAKKMTLEYFDKENLDKQNHDLFAKKYGQIIQVIYRYLKNRFEVPRYTSIKRIEFQTAINYLDSITLSQFKPREIRMTAVQKELLEA